MDSLYLQIKLNDQLLLFERPIVMGVINVTPDSFFSGNRFSSDRAILNTAEKMLSDGAMILDVGGYSTRPGAELVSPDDEIRRVSSALELICIRFPHISISIDTFRSSVVRQIAANYPIGIVNDIGGGTLDELMFQTIADCGLAYVLMHMRGTPQSMSGLTDYDDLISEVFGYFEKRIKQLRLLGVTDIIIDPGFGFAKTVEQNFQLLKKLSYFSKLNVPILAGLSRKSMLWKTLDITPERALNATTAVNILALLNGANILRVHDVKEAMEAITLFENYLAEQ